MRRIPGFTGRTGDRSWPATLGPWLWFSFVALVVTAPLLGAGYLLLLDYPSGPALPHVPLLPLPSSGDVGVGLWLFGLAAIDLHVAGMYALLVLIAGVTALSRRGSIGAAVGLGLGAILCAYWVLPSLFASPGRGIGAADLAVYASHPPGVGVLPRLVGLYGFWRDEFAEPAQRIPALYLLIVPILSLSMAGAIHV